MWWFRFLNWIGWRKDTIFVMCQEDTWTWGPWLGEKTAGKCSRCKLPIWYEKQNWVFPTKICNRCAIEQRTEAADPHHPDGGQQVGGDSA